MLPAADDHRFFSTAPEPWVVVFFAAGDSWDENEREKEPRGEIFWAHISVVFP